MKDRSGAKKLYKTHRGWIAAGVAALTLFSAQALADQTVQAATTDTATTTEQADTDQTTDTAAQQQLETAIQQIIDAANAAQASDYTSAKAAMAKVATAQQQMTAAQNNGASLDAVPASLTAAMNTAQVQLAQLQATVNAGPQTDTTKSDAEKADTDAANANKTPDTADTDANKPADTTDEDTDANKTSDTTVVDADKPADTTGDDTDANKSTDTTDTDADAAQTQLNTAAQTMVDAVNNADLSTAAGYQTASDAVKTQEQALKSAQDAGADMNALPADLKAQLTTALKALQDAQSAAQTKLNTAAQAMVDAVNNADLTTDAGYQAASDAVTAQEQAMNDAVAAGAAMSAIPEALHTDLSAALDKLGAVQQEKMPQTKLDAAAQRVVDIVNAVDPSSDASIIAAKTAVEQQELAVSEALNDGAQMAKIPLDLQSDLDAALDKLADYLKVPEAQAHLEKVANGIIETAGNIDMTSPKSIQQALEDYEKERSYVSNDVENGARLPKLPATLYTSVTDAINKLNALMGVTDLDSLTDLQKQLNETAQAFVNNTNELNSIDDNFNSAAWKVEHDALSDKLFKLIDQGASALDIPSDLQMALNKALQTGVLKIDRQNTDTGQLFGQAVYLFGVPGTTRKFYFTDPLVNVPGYEALSLFYPNAEQQWTYTSSLTHIIWLYQPTAQDVTIHYTDAVTGATLKADSVLPAVGKTDTTIDLGTQGLDTTIAGYTLQSALNPNYLIKGDGNDITLLYQGNPQTVTVHYQAANGKELQAATNLDAVTGETVDLSAQDLPTTITGYTLGSDLNPAYVVKDGNNSITLLYIPAPQAVTISYKDANTGAEIQPATMLNNVGVTGETVDLTTLGLDTDVEGYRLKNVLDPAYKLLASDNGFTLLYTGKAQDVTIRFVDVVSGKDLQPAKTLRNVGITGSTVDLTQFGLDTTVTGYTLQSTLDSAYKLGASNNGVTLRYLPSQQDMTIRYLNALTGKDLKSATILPNVGVTGDTIDLNQFGLDTTVAGYTMQSTLDSAYTLRTEDNGVSLLYFGDRQDFTIYYLDYTTGVELKDATILHQIGMTGKTIDLSKQGLDTTIVGYTQVNQLNSARLLEPKPSDNYFKVQYLAAWRDLQIRYVDAATGQELRSVITLRNIGKTGSTADLTQKFVPTDIAGYTLKNALDPAYKVLASNNVFTLRYKANAQDLTVRYLNALTGEDLKPANTVSNVGVSGETIDLNKLGLDTAIAGYTLQNALNPAYKVVASHNGVSLLYFADAQPITVHFEDEAGNSLKAEQTVTGQKTGDTVDLTQKGIDTAVTGYTLQNSLNTDYVVKATGNDVTLIYAPAEQTVTIHYKNAKTGAELKTPTTLNDVAKTGDTLDLTKQNLDTVITGYTLQNALDPAYVVKASDNDIDLLYQGDSQKLIVHSVLAGTKTKLIADQTIAQVGATGDVIDLSKAGIRTNVPGYQLKTPLDTAYVVTAGDNEIWVEYVKKDLPSTDNGGGTTTTPGGNPDNGGGTMTNPGGNPDNGGGTTPGGNPDSGGGTTTTPGGNPDNGGNTTTTPGGNPDNGGNTTTTPGSNTNNGGTPANGSHGGTTTPTTNPSATGTNGQPTPAAVTPVSVRTPLPATDAESTTKSAKPAQTASYPQTGDEVNTVAAAAGLGLIAAVMALLGLDIKKRRA